jgi:hypothetical protein
MLLKSKYWTDGYVYAPGIPSNQWLVKCPVCTGLFFVDEAVEVGQGFDAAKGKEPVLAPAEKELIGFLAENVLSKDKEIFLRIRVWWSANHTWRIAAIAESAFSEVQAQNLNALYRLLDESEPGQRILKAEIARELGEFEQCLALLSYQASRHGTPLYLCIMSLNQCKVIGGSDGLAPIGLPGCCRLADSK